VNCPKCNAKSRGKPSEVREQSLADVELAQQRRVKACNACGHRWPTIELDAAEVARLRTLAHRATMKGL
jgi:transcriptional regulator NrdR family protein